MKRLKNHLRKKLMTFDRKSSQYKTPRNTRPFGNLSRLDILEDPGSFMLRGV